jgi:acyl-CoA thioesterase YciA
MKPTKKEKYMELISSHICKASEIGIHGNMFGGTMMSLIDEASAVYASQICDTPKIVTIKIDELVFKEAVKVGNLLKIYGKVIDFGTTSVTLYIEVRKHNVYTGQQQTVTHTNIKFVRIDEDGKAIPISVRVKSRYKERLEKFGKGLLSYDDEKVIPLPPTPPPDRILIEGQEPSKP